MEVFHPQMSLQRATLKTGLKQTQIPEEVIQVKVIWS